MDLIKFDIRYLIIIIFIFKEVSGFDHNKITGH